VDSYLPDLVLQGVQDNNFRGSLSNDLKFTLQVCDLNNHCICEPPDVTVTSAYRSMRILTPKKCLMIIKRLMIPLSLVDCLITDNFSIFCIGLELACN